MMTCRYFNTDRKVECLLQVLRKSVLGKRSYDLSLQAMIYHKVFDDTLVQENGLNKKQRAALQHKVNALKELAEQILILESRKKSHTLKYDLLYPELLARKLFRLFDRHVKRDRRQQKGQLVKDALHYGQGYKLELEVLACLHQNGKLVTENNLPELNLHLDLYYLLNKLDLHLTALSLQWISGKKVYDPESTENYKPLLVNPDYAKHPLVLLYTANIELFETQRKDAYFRLLQLLDHHSVVTPVKLRKYFYATAINFCAHQVKKGQLDYTQNMFKLYEYMHEKQLIIEDGFIPVGRLINMVISACRVVQFDWARDILEQYRKFIHQPIRDNIYRFNLGTIAFHRKDYEAAHQKFSQMSPVSPVIDINARILILKCLYEKGKQYSEPTIQAFRSAESFFKNQQSLSPINKKGYKNFIRILINLYRIRYQATKMPLEDLKKKLESQEVNSDKRWLQEKIEELNLRLSK